VTVDKPGVPVELGGAVLPDASLGLLQYCYFSDAASAVKYESVLAGSVVQKFEIKNADAARIEIVTGGKTSTIPLKNVTHIHFSNDARSGADGNHFGIYYGTLASTYDPKYHLYPCRDGYPPVAHDAQRPPQKAGTNKWNRLIRLDADDPFPTRSMPVYCPPVIKE